MPSRDHGMFLVNTLVYSMKMLCVGADRRVRPRLTDSSYGIGICGFAECPLSAFTKTTGMITNIHRVLGSRNRGNTLFCLMSVWLTPPVVYASGLHRTRRSARYVGWFC